MKTPTLKWGPPPEAESQHLIELIAAQTGIRISGFALPAAALKLQPLGKPRIASLLGLISQTEWARLREMVIRILAAAAEPFDFAPLMREYDTATIEDDEEGERIQYYRWAIANTIESAKPTNDIRPWIIEKLLGPPCFGKEMLLLAAGKHLKKNPPEEEIISTFSEHPLHAAAALAKIGGEKSLRFLRAHQERGAEQLLPEIRRRIELSTERVIEGRESLAFLRKRTDSDARGAAKAIQKEIEKSIAKIEKRLEKQKERDRRRKVGP